MKVKSFVLPLALVFALPAIAQESQTATKPAVLIARADVDAAAAAADQETPQQGDQPQEGTPTTEELAGKLESMNEGFTELRNVVDALNKMKMSGYIQAQYVNNESSVNELAPGTARGTRNNDEFSIRRGRVKFTYQFAPTSRFVIQPDITSSGVVLKDGYVEFTEPWTTSRNTLTAGQFNWPFGFEIGYSSSQREMPERSRVVRTLFPGERDRGLMLSGTALGERFSYRVAVVNGTGTNAAVDFNKRKDLVGRVGYTFGPLDLGASIYKGEDLVAVTGRPAGREFDKDRQGIDFQWVTPVQGLGVRGEYIRGSQPPSGTVAPTAVSPDVDGWYLYAIQNLGTRHQFVVRVDEFDPNKDVSGNATRTIGGSYIFHWDANSKVMVAYESPKAQRNDPDDNVFTLRYQYSF